MPVHPAIVSRFALLEGIPSRRVAMGDPEMMARIDQFFSPSPGFAQPVVDVRDDSAPGPHGPVPVRIYLPDRAPTDRPCLVWMHGGAFMGGDLDMPEADLTAREVCERAGAVVVSVDYRLAVNGVTYPVPHDDVVAAIRWVRDNPARLGIDPARISVGGGSAGGNLGTGAVLRLRDDDGWQPASLIPVYAVFHAVHPPVPRELAAALAELPPMLRPSPRWRPADHAKLPRRPGERRGWLRDACPRRA
jgi:acetyl esterase